MTGISRFYGVNLADGLVPSDDPGTSVMALKAGEVDLAVVPASSPLVHDPGVRSLRDDADRLVADHLVLLYRRELAGLYGPSVVRDLDTISQSITAESIHWLYGPAPRLDAATAATEWLATLPLSDRPLEQAGAPPLVIGTWGTVEQQLVATVVVRQVERRGQAALLLPLPTRNAALEALANGEVQVVPEYSASVLEHLNGAASEASADPVQTTTRLATYAGQFGALVTRPSPASIQAAFLVRRSLAEPGSLERLSDLQQVAQRITVELAPSPSAGGPAELAVPLREARPAAFGGRGYEVVALQQRLVQLGFSLTVTGQFDGATLTALNAFQAARGQPTTSIVDAWTQRLLDRATPAGDRPPGSPVVYLTFDDGPDPRYTPAILDLLDRYQAQATFFVLGHSVEEYPEITAAVVDRGHVLGNHTYRHPDLRRVSAERVQSELQRTADLILAATGTTPLCMRPPQGAINARVRAVTSSLGLAPVLWHVDTEDWRGRGSAGVIERAMAVHPGAVVLLHDGGGDRTSTVEATAHVLEALSAVGYRFESLPQC